MDERTLKCSGYNYVHNVLADEYFTLARLSTVRTYADPDNAMTMCAVIKKMERIQSDKSTSPGRNRKTHNRMQWRKYQSEKKKKQTMQQKTQQNMAIH